MSRAQPRSRYSRALRNFVLRSGPPVDHAVSRTSWELWHQILHADVGLDQGQ